MSKLKVGDRVAIYAAELELFGDKGTIEGLLTEGRLYAKLDSPNHLADTPRLHSKQCRRLKKKGRRRVWVEFDYHTNLPRAVADTYEGIEASWANERKGKGLRYVREFIEVRERK